MDSGHPPASQVGDSCRPRPRRDRIERHEGYVRHLDRFGLE